VYGIHVFAPGLLVTDVYINIYRLRSLICRSQLLCSYKSICVEVSTTATEVLGQGWAINFARGPLPEGWL